MNREWPEAGEVDDLGRDRALAEALAVIDPASRDPNYWTRFSAWVMRSSAGELGRRRVAAQLTVGDDLGRDPVLAPALAVMDPASRDANYWMRFSARVMSGAARELSRRRMVAHLTVGDVVQSWARTLVPTALLAAVLAGIVLWRSGDAPVLITVEELLVSEIQGETIPVMASPARVVEAVTFASEAF